MVKRIYCAMARQVCMVLLSVLIPSLVLVYVVLYSIDVNTSHPSISGRQQLHHYRRRMQTVVGQVLELRLINADTDLPIVTLLDGMIINIATQNTTKFNIEATTDSGSVGSILFSYNGLNNFRTESERPFAFCGDGSPIGNYRKCSNLVVGQHTVSAASYSGAGQSGTIGNTKTVTFNLIFEPGCNVPKV